VPELSRKQQHTIASLRLSAVQARRLVDRAPEIAVELRHMAWQLDAEADELEERDSE
jgi:hypothetical protein